MALTLAVAAVVVAAGLAACGGESKPPVPATPNPSRVKASGWPIKYSHSSFGLVSCEAQVDSPIVHMGKDPQHRDRELHLQSAGALALAEVLRDGRRYLLVAEVGAEYRLVLTRFHDIDGDGFPDGASRTELLTSGDVPMFIVGIAVRSSAVLYLADARCGDVLVAVDGDGDGWVDRLKPKRFARSDDLPDIGLVDVAYVRDTSTGAHLVYAMHEFGNAITELRYPYKILKDADGDDVAESADDVTPRDLHPIVQKGRLTEGETEIHIVRDAASGAAVYEAWRLDAEGADVERLGEGAVEAGVADGFIRMKMPLEARVRVGIRWGSDKKTEVRLEVIPLWPTLETVTPEIVPPGGSAELLLKGARFSKEMSIRLIRVGTSEELKFVLIDSESAKVTIRLGADDTDFGLVVLGPGQTMGDPSVPVRAVDVRVRRP